jgi:hypothetical protein
MESQARSMIGPTLNLESKYLKYSKPVLQQVQYVGCPVKQTSAYQLFEDSVQNELNNIQTMLISLFKQREDLCSSDSDKRSSASASASAASALPDFPDFKSFY